MVKQGYRPEAIRASFVKVEFLGAEEAGLGEQTAIPVTLGILSAFENLTPTL